jgi:hypothetical protein
MSLPSNGITQGVIREMMPPYHLSPDLLEATLAALPPPPPDAPALWRQARITRLQEELSTLMPANAAQARLASQILIVRELADAIARRAYAPELTGLQMCRVGRASAELVRTAGGLVRALERSQQKPVPFFGTVLADGIDVAAIAAGWGGGSVACAGAGAMRQPATAEAASAEPGATPEPGSGGEVEDAAGASKDEAAEMAAAEMAGSIPGAGAPVGQAGWQAQAGQGLSAMTRREMRDIDPTQQSAAADPASRPGDATPPEASAQPGRSSGTAADHGRGVGSTSEGVVTRLDQGPGWTLDVVRPRIGGAASVGAAPGTVA